MSTSSLLVLLAGAIFVLNWSKFQSVGATFSRGHDGSTVSLMMTRRGYGGGTTEEGHCVETEGCEKGEEVGGASPKCWGYERGCGRDERLFVPRCEEPARPWGHTLEEKADTFWKQGDFGYIKDVVDSLIILCGPKTKRDSLLQCSEHLRYCKADNLFIDFRRFKEITQMTGKYRSFLEDIFHDGEIGGHCSLNSQLLRTHGDHKSPLQSWYAELERFSELNFAPSDGDNCDEVVEKPTVFIKLDAGVNMYHHFCDFFNLFASQHVNGSFSDDIYIVMWDTSYYIYPELFGDTWQAFSRHPLKRLADFEGKRVCFRDAMFPLLARMRHGLFYNTYLAPGCYGSGLMQSFSKHLLSRLSIHQHHFSPSQIRVTLLSRSTKHRRIINEEERVPYYLLQLVGAMTTVGFLDVHVVDYKARVFPFLEQIESSYNSDIFIGMHGSGLTHLLFLPDWGAVFEIYNTEDPRCYYDLARLRGVEYITWEKADKMSKEAEGKHPSLDTPHAKFTNYSFDVEEFMQQITALADRVLERRVATLSHTVLGPGVSGG